MQTREQWSPKHITRITLSLVTLVLLTTVGCSHFYRGDGRERQNASIVDFLFPKGGMEIARESVPTLALPVDVGIAFVPPSGSHNRHRGQTISEEAKGRLLKSVAREFEEYKFVRRIDVIPSSYLREGGGFENLDQVAKMFGVQVIALSTLR